MRFMMLMIPLGYETAPPDVKLDPERGRGDDEIQRGAEGCRRADHARRPASAVDGRAGLVRCRQACRDRRPFTEVKEVLGGYWMIEVESREEAIAWASKCPASENEIIEIRQVQEMSDFPEEMQQAAAGFTSCKARRPRLSLSPIHRRKGEQIQ